MKENLGVEYAMQSREVQDRMKSSGHKIKEVEIGGYSFRLRGFEPQAIEILIAQHGCQAASILHTASEGLPSVEYQDYVRKGGKVVKVEGKKTPQVRQYHPDLLVLLKGVWTLIEVKSVMSLGLCTSKGIFAQVQRKAQGCVDSNFYPYKLLLVLDKNHAIFVDDILTVSKSKLLRRVAKFRQAHGL